jgi:hypothetical protein
MKKNEKKQPVRMLEPKSIKRQSTCQVLSNTRLIRDRTGIINSVVRRIAILLLNAEIAAMRSLWTNPLELVRRSVGGRKFDGLAVRGVAVGVGPGFFAGEEGGGIGKPFSAEQALESGKPVVVIMRAIVGLAAVGGGFEFGGEGGGPFFPSEVALLGEFHG